MTLLDGLGQWTTLGTITPLAGQWLRFLTPAVAGYQTFRATFSGEWFSGGWHWVWLREVYQGAVTTEGKWIKVYPSNLPKIIYFSTSEEFNILNPQRYFEVLKAHKYQPTYGGRFSDKIFSVKLEEFSPYPELIEEATRQRLAAQSITEIVTAILEAYPQLPPPST